MRLLERNSAGEISLTQDFVFNVPRYAILSHTWGPDEVLFKELVDGTGKSKLGYHKIRFCADQAWHDGLQFCWVDTCCIDKTNFPELQEAITSMFRWYRDAAKCYVHLADVSIPPALGTPFRNSRWFTRGWTLQELIAPASVEFFSREGQRLGNRRSLEQDIHKITGVPVDALRGSPLSGFSVPERLAWMDKRETTREEDKAYSLQGILDVSMALIYGEGRDNAFKRLLNEASQREGHPTRVSHSIDAPIKQSLVEQLYFDKIDERLTHLMPAQGTTCRWFLAKPEYTCWHDMAQQPDHGGFLWIKGHPGTGKSTLMKLLFGEAKSQARDDSSQIILSFFFLARGTDEEKSTTGLYRSLLHQLFDKAPDLRDSLDWMTADGARVIQRSGWSEEPLKQTLTHAVRRLGSRQLMIFVDALDECRDSQDRDMICFFEELCDLAREMQLRLQICLSSRHYPHIEIKKGIEIILEDEDGHKDDIEQYIKSKLRLRKTKQAELLQSEVLEKSSRIFLWVVLVVDILNSEYPGKPIDKMRRRLEEIPLKLADLFEMILTRDGENPDQLQLCLQWILFATRPLKPQELYFAIQLGLDKECLSSWDPEDVELDQMKTFVRSSSKGLAEVTRNKASEVQFIHESVRDFLLGKYGGQWSRASSNFVGHSHEILRDCCLAQLSASINRAVDVPDPLPQASKAAQLRQAISLKFPFLEYSVLNVLRHTNSAQQHMMEQGAFLADFPLRRWVVLNNTLERYDVRRYTESVSLLYILAEKNLADLIRIHPQRESYFDVEVERPERYGPPIFAALATGSDEAVRAFLEVQANIQPPTSRLHDLYKEYSENKANRANPRRDFNFRRRGIPSHVVVHGGEVIFAFLLASGELDANSRDKDGRTPLSWAAEKGNEAIVKLLLQNGVDFNAKDTDGRTPLMWATLKGHEAIVKLLLENGVDVNAKDLFDQTPLIWAIRQGHEAIVKLLLENGVDVDAKDERGRTPLIWAIREGHEAIVKLLLENGVDVDAKDQGGWTPLIWATEKGNEAIVKLLVTAGKVNVDCEG
ncbi:hypothetical protein QBC46DRAFT_353953 [Diplogelasinospora grovesii]|uniref:NACHT domain-containing protein n=1 Tax=Diplogelasinospora grovesii TaxID=303347 RepID=A0AAN6N8N5_9PEZI|nr:hypothetical protein QBC46DRAFT_353953 [Diplogelasinospora grovesii]